MKKKEVVAKRVEVEAVDAAAAAAGAAAAAARTTLLAEVAVGVDHTVRAEWLGG